MSANLAPLRLLALALAVLGLACDAAEPERFGLFVATLDGREVRRILSDPRREMNHARVSPDGNWITFTRYNKPGWNGLAKEEGGYQETEIMLARIDGSELRSLVPPRKDTVAANGYWTPDGKAILYVSTDNPRRRGQINRIDLATGRVEKVAIAGDPWAADPHQVGQRLAVSVFDEKRKANSIWLVDLPTGAARQVSHHGLAGIDSATKAPLGDFDPKLSPDGRKIVAMRNLGRHNWHIVVIDPDTGRERDLSAAQAVDGVPEWSGDGRQLVFWHVDPSGLKNSGLYAMNPDGGERRRIPLPGGHFYTMPTFFPGEASGGNARLIFSAERNPHL